MVSHVPAVRQEVLLLLCQLLGVCPATPSAADCQAALAAIPPPPGGWPVAVDFETYYDGDECTVEKLGNYAYCRHSLWEAYMVSIWAPDIQFCGDPKDAPWEKIVGRRWLAHNRNFDRHVFERLWETGVVQIPGFDTFKPIDPPWSSWDDTADLAPWSHLPRNLNGASGQAFGLTLDKGARKSMKGVKWSEVPEENKPRIWDYALEDAAFCWALWWKYSPNWPAHEQKLSQHTGNIEFRGIPVSLEQIEKDISTLETAKWKTEQRIPWVNTENEDTGKPYTLRSKKALKLECLKCGVPPPATTAAKSKEFQEWLDEYGEKVPALLDLSRYRRIDRSLSVYKSLLRRIRPDGRAALGLKYFGAPKTGRWAGTSKFNLQNLLKTPLYFDADFYWLDAGPGGEKPAAAVHSADIRACIVASPGNELLVADLSQIEPRVLNWIIKNKAFLQYIRDGFNPYEAHARASMGWTGGILKDEDPQLYALAKARILALGYGAGWQKFIEMARGYLGTEEAFLAVFAVEPPEGAQEKFLSYLQWMVDNMGNAASKAALSAWDELDEQTRRIWVNSWTQVRSFRDSNPLIADKEDGLWATLDADFKASNGNDSTGVFENVLPSGRSLMYYGVSASFGWTSRQGDPTARPVRTYGGLLTENLVQAIARDVFALGVLALEEAGYKVLFHVHDEVIIEAPIGSSIEHAKQILTQVPDWAKSLPVGASGKVSDRYFK